MSRRDDPPAAAEGGAEHLPAVEPGDGAPAAVESGTDVETVSAAVGVPSASTAVVPGTVPAASHESLRALWIQFAAVLVALAGLWSFLAFGPLSPAERTVVSPGSLWTRTLEHLGLTAVAAVLVLALVLPLGLALARGPLRRLGRPVLVVAGIGEGAPAIGLMVLLACALGFGVRSSIAGLVACAVLPALRVFVAGVQRMNTPVPVPVPTTGPGNGPAASSRGTVPLLVLLTTVRTTLVVVVGAAALAAFTGGGGLGVLLTTGVEHQQSAVTVVGAGLVSLLAVVADWLGRFAEVLVRRRHPAPGAEPEV